MEDESSRKRGAGAQPLDNEAADAEAHDSQQPAKKARTQEIAAAAAAATTSSMVVESHAQRLYRDGVHSVFAFLGVSDLVSSSRCCRNWRSHMASKPSGGFAFRLGKEHPVALLERAMNLAGSPLRHQLGSLQCADVLYPSAVARLCAALAPALTRLQLWVTEEVVGGGGAPLAPLVLPPKLTHLTVDLLPAHAARLLPLLLNAAGQCSRLSTLMLQLVCFDQPCAALDFAPLLGLPQLTDLTLELVPTEAQCTVLKQLATLRALRVCSKNPSPVLQRISTLPHQLQQLQALHCPISLSSQEPEVMHEADVLALATLPALTLLPLLSLDSSAIAALHLLPKLRSLQFERYLSEDALEAGDFFSEFEEAELAHLLACPFLPNLRQMDLSFLEDLSETYTQALCNNMHNLLVLSMHTVGLPNLGFLQLLPQLQQLALDDCSEQLCAQDMDYITAALAAGSLVHLHVSESPRTLVSEAAHAALRVPSALWPRLLCFRYSDSDALRDFTHAPHHPCQNSMALRNGADQTQECCLPNLA